MTVQQRRTVFVTGASGAIGGATVRRFVEEGARVALADIDREGVEEFALALREECPGCDVLPLVVDQSSEHSLRKARDAVRGWSGRLDVLVLVAGTTQAFGASVMELPIAEWDRVHSINLRGVFLSCRELLPLIPEHEGGNIIAVSSFWGRQGHPLYSSYCTSKAGVISFVQCLAAELADAGIRVNSVAPGNIDTGMHRKALRDEAESRGITFEEMRDIEWGKIPLRRAGSPASVADATHFLSTDRASYMTGATLDVNGGVLFV